MKSFPFSLLLATTLFFVSCQKTKETTATAPSGSAAIEASSKPAYVLPEVVSFNEHIQPIFADTCYHCHGPDSGTREPKKEPLRLDGEKYAFAPREDGKPVIKPGDPAGSSMIQLIKEKDPDIRMPPPEAHKEIRPEQLALLERWIEQGAKYEEHWAFIAPKKSTPPAVKQADWAKNPIDSFVLAKIEENKFTPNEVENPRRLYRRLSFDLTGLPPSKEAVDAFEKAFTVNADEAMNKAADDLLASVQSAEHFGRQWLDAARYADTHGIHIDNYRSIWPYRDWVIDAFYKNMPWDQFTIEQFGGDLMPNASLDQIVATGFHRCLPTTGEGGAIAEEYDAIYATDRVSTTTAVWLGITAQCAACHDHKFDPVSMKEFYQLSAFFRNTPMSALDGNNGEHPPNIFVPRKEDRPRMAAIEQELKVVEKNLTDRAANAKSDFDQWLAAQVPTSGDVADPSLVLHLPLDETDGPLRGNVNGQPYEYAQAIQRRDTPTGKALQADAQVINVGDVANFKRTDSFTYSTFVFIEGAPSGAVFARMNHAENYRGWDFWLEAGKPAVHVIDTWQDKASKIVAEETLMPGAWHHVAISFDGSKPSAQTLAIYINGKLAKHSATASTVGDMIQTNVPFTIGSRTGGSNIIGNTAIQDLRIYQRLLNADEIAALSQRMPLQNILAIPADQRTPAQNDALLKNFLTVNDPVSKKLRDSLVALKAEHEQLKARGAVSLVMQEKAEEPFAHVLERGSYASKSEKVGVGVPAVLPPMAADLPKNRLGLAKWLMDPKNPLPARVTINRLWGYIFGTGIVETVEDFGIMGARPSHPQLLDWLAIEFIESKWNYRHMAKLMVTSATYRQSAHISPEKIEADPMNRLLARAPRFRLEAEPLRDSVLHNSQLLAPQVGGPSVRPYQPEGIWETVAMDASNTRDYKQDSGESLHRRSMYTIWKRSAHHPAMEILNAPSREVFCVRRERTNTPLQAFVTMNDPQFVEGYRQLAARTMQSAAQPEERLQFLAGLILSRSLSKEEITTLQDTVTLALNHYSKVPSEATKLITIGESRADANLPAHELAAWTIVTSQLYNLDEALTK